MSEKTQPDHTPFYARFTEKKKGKASASDKKTARNASSARAADTARGPHGAQGSGRTAAPESPSRKGGQGIDSRQPRGQFEPVVTSRLFAHIPADAARVLAGFDDLVQSVLPLSGKQFRELSGAIRELSHLLTDERSELRAGYMNEAPYLSAYIRYFMWWNLARLVPVFASLAPSGTGSPFVPADGAVLLDIGSGPLTVPCALWLARPDLRTKNLTWLCLDHSQPALSAGEELFLALAASTGGVPWKIVKIKGAFGTEIREKADAVFCGNMFNELFLKSVEPIEALVKRYAQMLFSYAAPDASFCVVEPGVPRSGRFISLLRETFLRGKYSAISPCPHQGACPMPGTKGAKWCHFARETEGAPARLLRLSEEAGLPKSRATLSFLFASRGEGPAHDTEELHPEDAVEARIVSDVIRFGDREFGRYGCSDRGLVLVGGQGRAGYAASALCSGDLALVKLPPEGRRLVDEKSGALYAEPLVKSVWKREK